MNAWWEQVSTMFVEPAKGWPGCDAGHSEHGRTAGIVAPAAGITTASGMMMFDAARYRDTYGYCPGDDDVSRTLLTTGMWEPIESQMFYETLLATPGVVLDIGAHIGWYSLIACLAGRTVYAFEAVSEHIELWRANVASGDAHIVQAWIDENHPYLPLEGAPDIAIAKIDIEGNERYALGMLNDLIVSGKVANILMEVSPTFNDSYPDLIRMLMRRGYSAEVCNPNMSFEIFDVNSVCAMFPQVDMMFRRQQ